VIVQEATGVHQSTLSKIERGLVQPSAPQANALAGYFGRPIMELLAPPNIAA
jgi:transcriptional regulator with XRE-family HTH domain